MRGAPVPGAPEQDFWSTGTYKEIVPMDKLVVVDSFADENGNIVSASHYGMPDTFPMESTITIMLEEDGSGKTKMTVTYPTTEGIEGKMLEDMKHGWSESFEKLEKVLKED